MPTYTVGPGKTYSTITTALAAIPSNITGTGVHMVLIDAGLYVETITASSRTGTSATDYINITCVPGFEHKGNISSGVRIQSPSGQLGKVITLGCGNRLSNVVIIYSVNYQFGSGFGASSGVSSLLISYVENVIINITGTGDGFTVGNVGNYRFYKCLVIATTGNAIVGFDWQNDAFFTSTPYSCGSYNCGIGFRTLNSSGRAINCWSQKFTGSFNNDFVGILTTGSSNNASSDSSAPGSSSLTNRTASQFGFASVSTSNFHLTSTSTLVNVGTNLSSFFTTDIDLETIVTYSIGPDAYSIVHTYLLGPTRLYTTMAGVGAAIPSNLAGTGVHEIIADASVYTATFSNGLSKSGTSATDYIYLHAAPGSEHLGNVNAGVIFTVSNDNGTAFSFPLWTRLSDIVFKGPLTGTGQVLTPFGSSIFKNVIVMAGSGYGYGIVSLGFGNTFINCIVTKRDISSVGTFLRGFNPINGDKLYNCASFYHSSVGFLGTNGTSIPCINCWSIAAPGSGGSGFNGGGGNFNGSSNNASSDNTAPGAGSLFSLTLTQAGFADYTNANFHISIFSLLNGKGKDSSSVFTTDVDGQTIINWCIGPDSTFLDNITATVTVREGDVYFDGGLSITYGDVNRDGTFSTAVSLSLFTDKRAFSDDTLPSYSRNLRGFWGDPDLGSRLWLLSRSKNIDSVRDQAKFYCLEALKWMVEDGLCQKIIVDVSRYDTYTISISVQVIAVEQFLFKYRYNWKLQMLETP